jgi:hypothetical protein
MEWLMYRLEGQELALLTLSFAEDSRTELARIRKLPATRLAMSRVVAAL